MTDYQDLLRRLRLMGDREIKHDYTIGHYWNVVDEAADALEALIKERDYYRKHLDWGSANREAFATHDRPLD